MQRVWNSDSLTLLLVVAGVMLPFSSAADAQDEQVIRRQTSDRDSATIPVGATNGEIEPSNVFAHVALLRSELEMIRSEMGMPRHRSSKIEADNVSAREVFFQAQTLFRKADDLCFEISRQRGTLPRAPAGEIMPAHVWSVVDAALDGIRAVKAKLAITEQSRLHTPVASHSPTDVFRSIVQANRQLNLLLERNSSPSELFQQVTASVSYSSRLLGRFPGIDTIPVAPPLDPDSDLQDVRVRLLDCLGRVQAIAKRSGLEVMGFSWNSSDTGASEVSELYDVATIIVSELAYMHAMHKETRAPQRVYYPGEKSPAQICERVGILALQLEHLHQLVEENPNWLNSARAQSRELMAEGGGTTDGDNR